MKLADFIDRPIADLVPHRPPMLLLDRVAAVADDHFECEVTLRQDSGFCVDGRVGAWVGLEYMAQTVAAYAGAEALIAGQKVKLGLLLGTRRYEAKVPHFTAGSTLRIRASKILYDPSGLGLVDCALYLHPSGEALAKASLIVFRVDDLRAFLESQPK